MAEYLVRTFTRPPRDAEIEPDLIAWFDNFPDVDDAVFTGAVRAEIYLGSEDCPIALWTRANVSEPWYKELFQTA